MDYETNLNTEEFPFFSIVIPTYNRPQSLQSCLQALTQLDYPRDRFEVIVVDDGSSTPLDQGISQFQAQLDLNLIKQQNAGPASARNTGAAKAKGQFLAFTDDDCAPTPDWLRAFARQFTKTPSCLVGGKTINALPNNLYSTAHQLFMDYFYSSYGASPQQAHFFASNNMALPTDLFRQLEGFDTTFPLAAGEDREFCDRWLHHGYSMFYVSDAQVGHAHQLTLQKFWRQHFNYGQGAFHFHQTLAQRGSGRIKLESLSFYCKLLTYPLQHPTSQPNLLIAALFLISQVANASGFFWQCWQTHS
jgi:glycosyltransferase involved in cell wall biosynthesis